MKLALISLSKDSPDGSGPIGFLPLFDGMLLDQQIEWVKRAGVERIILISPTMNSQVLQYIDQRRGQELDIETVRSGQDLVQFSSPENDILYLDDGILPSDAMTKKMADHRGEMIFVAKDTDFFADFERIDRNDRWLGIAQLDAEKLSGFIDVPEDWDVGSALLRGAVQSGCQRIILNEQDFLAGTVSRLSNEGILAQYSRQRLKQATSGSGNFLQRWAVWPFTRAVLPKLWKAPQASTYLGWSALVAAPLAALMPLLNLPVSASLALLLLGSLMLSIRNRIRLFSGISGTKDLVTATAGLLTGLALFSFVWRSSIPVSLIPNLVIFALALGSVWLAYRVREQSKWSWIKPDILLSLTVVLVFSVTGSFMPGIYGVALLAMFYLLGSGSEGVSA